MWIGGVNALCCLPTLEDEFCSATLVFLSFRRLKMLPCPSIRGKAFAWTRESWRRARALLSTNNGNANVEGDGSFDGPSWHLAHRCCKATRKTCERKWENILGVDLFMILTCLCGNHVGIISLGCDSQILSIPQMFKTSPNLFGNHRQWFCGGS